MLGTGEEVFANHPDAEAPPPPAVQESPPESLLAHQQAVEQSAGKANDLLVAKLGQLRPSAETVSTSVTREWSSEFDRVDFNIAEYCFVSMGKLDAKVLYRHPRLNPRDQCISSNIMAELQSLIAAINDTQSALAAAYSELYREEAVSQIDAGMIKPREGPRIDERTLGHLARIQQREGKYPDKTIEEIKDLLRTTAVSLDVDGIVHRGEVYPADRLVNLPLTDASFLTRQFIAIETVGGITAWFSCYGLTSSDLVAPDIEEFSRQSRVDLAKRGPGYRR